MEIGDTLKASQELAGPLPLWAQGYEKVNFQRLLGEKSSRDPGGRGGLGKSLPKVQVLPCSATQVLRGCWGHGPMGSNYWQ
jgi:hypothetical protein